MLPILAIAGVVFSAATAVRSACTEPPATASTVRTAVAAAMREEGLTSGGRRASATLASPRGNTSPRCSPATSPRVLQLVSPRLRQLVSPRLVQPPVSPRGANAAA